MINKIFDVVAAIWDNIPVINKLKGSRSIIGLVGLAVVYALQAYGIGSATILSDIQVGLLAFVGLSLNSKGREE